MNEYVRGLRSYSERSECFRRLLHSEFERKWTRTFGCYVQKMNVLERFHSNFTFKI